jgi:hypothetical protein
MQPGWRAQTVASIGPAVQSALFGTLIVRFALLRTMVDRNTDQGMCPANLDVKLHPR